MHQDGIHRRVSLKRTCYCTGATWCQNLLPDTHTRAHNNSVFPLRRRHLMWRSTPHKFEGTRNASFFFFLITWKWKGTKPLILQAVKLPFQLDERVWNRPRVTGSQGPQCWTLGIMVRSEVHGLTLFLGPLCSNTGSQFSVIFHHEVFQYWRQILIR